ncbi:MAG: MATE family efflux transporter [Clostridia bacterium]|nr:MATE family efflux transporter [Clostridia bacterium]
MAIKENKMGVEPVGTLLLKMAIPLMFSMLIQALYNFVDGVFIAKISQEAFTAISVSLVLQNLTMGVIIGTAVGTTSTLSKALGAMDYERANKTAGNGIFLSLILAVIAAVISILLINPFLRLQTSSQQTFEYGREYLIICMIGLVAPYLQIIFERILQATGKAMLSTIIQVTGALINIILDPIMIFGLFGFPKMGVKGAAIATVTAQAFAAILGLIINLKFNKELSFKLKYLKPDLEIIKKIFEIGLSSAVMISITSVMLFLANRILRTFSETAIAVLGAYFKIQNFIFMTVFGINQALIPIVSYNYGAKKRKRIDDVIKYAVLYSFILMVIGTLIVELLPRQLLGMFSANADMMRIGIPAFRIIGLSFLFAGIDIILSSTFQSLGKPLRALLISFIRQMVVLMPVMYLLSLKRNLDLVWAAFPISEVICLIVCLTLFFDMMKNLSVKRTDDNKIDCLENESY